MPSALGFVAVGLQIGLDAILVKPKRGFADFTAQVTLEEVHTDELEITDHPVEQGAAITDHAFHRPAEVRIECGWSNSPGDSSLLGSLGSAITGTIGGIQSLLTGNSVSQVKDIYARLIELQLERVPFTVYTGKRVYRNMLVKTLSTTTDKDSENILVVKATFREVIIVATSTTSSSVEADPDDQEDPEDTEPTSDEGTEQLDESTSYNEADGAESFAGDDDFAQPEDTTETLEA